ncbi:MAG: hypothetical protein PHW60_10455 [Kiritimatiellae bacterium]|nr:hypothetical protein [Kiritimatiellia bacterium]
MAVISEEVDVVMDVENTNVLRQVMSTECLADIITNSDRNYTVSFYHAADVDSALDTNGYYKVKAGGSSFACYTINNPSATNTDRLFVFGGLNGDILTNEFVWTEAAKELSLNKGGMRYEGHSEATNGPDRIITYTVRDSGQTLISERRDTRRTFAWGEALSESAIDPNGLNLMTTRSYYDNRDETGKYSQVKLKVQPDGQWVRYDDYNIMGRVTMEVRSWKDAATNAAAIEARAIYSLYAAVDANDDLSVDFWKPRTVQEEIEGVAVSRKYYAYYKTIADERVEIEEVCADVGSAYGANGNLRTKKIYYPKSKTDVGSEQIKRQEYPDGKRDSYSYEYGSYVTNADPSACYFDANGTGNFVRVTIIHGVVTNESGIAGKTTKETIVKTLGSRELMRETYVYQAETNYMRVTWVVSQLDALGHPINVYKSNGTHSEATWSCCGKEYEKDENGVECYYVYDALKRLTQKLKKGVPAFGYPAQADQYTTYTYDAEGRQLTATVSADGLSQVSSNTYDLAGRITKSTDSAGLVTEYAYTDSGRTTTETLPGGYTRITERYKDGQVKSITGTAQMPQYYAYGVNEDGTKYTTVYSASNNSPVWVKTTTDLFDRAAKVEKPGYNGTETTEYTYNSKSQLIKTTTSGQADTLYAYDDMGNQIRSGLDVDANGTLDLTGTDRITETDKAYVQISNDWFLQTANKLYAVDNSADAITNGITRQRLTGFSGNLVAETVTIDAYGNQTVSQTTVDRNNQLVTKITDVPDSASNAITVSVNGLLVSSTKAHGLQPTVYSYDALGRRTGVSDPRTGIATTHYDSHGWVDYVEDAASNRTCFTYDSATGRRISQSDPLSNTSYSSYTSHGQLEKTWGSGTYPVSYEYDAYGRMTKMNTYRGGTGWSNSTWSASPGTADTTEWIYHEASGLLTSKKDAAGKSVSYTYSTGGKLSSREWARNNLITTYFYNNAGDLTGINYSDSTPDVSFTCDRLGRQKTITDGLGVREFSYQILNLQSEMVPDGAGGTNTITRTYDSLGRPTGFSMGSDYSVAYGYDSVGRFSVISSSVQSVSSVVNYSYLPNSDLISGLSSVVGHLSSASTRSYEDHRNLLMQIKNQVGSATISQYDYVNDGGGRRTSIKYSGSAFDVGNSFNLYGYDSRNEVQTADRYWGANANDTSDPVEDQTFAYNYDNIGNRTASLRKNDEMDYTANNLNQYTQRTIPGVIDVLGSAETNTTITVNELAASRHGMYWYKGLSVTNDSAAVYQDVNVVGVYSPPDTNDPEIVTSVTGHVFVAKTPEPFTYDDDGNLLSDGRFAYTWDTENRLVGAETLTNLPSSMPRVKVDFAYDYMSRRVSKKVYSWTSGSWLLTTDSSFLYDGWNMIRNLQSTASGLQTNSYVWGLDLSGSLSGAGGIGGLLAVSKGTIAYVPAADGNGNISDYVDGQGTLAAHYEFDPYGNLIVATGEHADDFAFLFSSKYLDRETSLYYYGYRYYSPALGRWLSRDPIGEYGGENLYRFVGNRPVDRLDRGGLLTVTEGEPHPGVCGGFNQYITFSGFEGVIVQRVTIQRNITYGKLASDGKTCCGANTVVSSQTFYEPISSNDLNNEPRKDNCTKGSVTVSFVGKVYYPTPKRLPPSDWDYHSGDGYTRTLSLSWDCWTGKFNSPTQH